MKWISIAVIGPALGLGVWVLMDRATHLRSRTTVRGLALTIRSAEWVEDHPSMKHKRPNSP